MKNALTLICVIVILVIVFMIVKTMKDTTDKLDELTKDTYKLETLQVSELEELMQIGAINFQEDVKIEKIKEGVFYDDEILASYTCNINIGIDFKEAKDGWAQKKADSAFLKLPPIKILNTDGNVIIRSSFPIRTGNWSNEELQQLGDSASTIFISKAKEKFPEAQRELKEKLKDILSLKYKYVDVKFED